MCKYTNAEKVANSGTHTASYHHFAHHANLKHQIPLMYNDRAIGALNGGSRSLTGSILTRKTLQPGYLLTSDCVLLICKSAYIRPRRYVLKGKGRCKYFSVC